MLIYAFVQYLPVSGDFSESGGRGEGGLEVGGICDSGNFCGRAVPILPLLTYYFNEYSEGQHASYLHVSEPYLYHSHNFTYN